MKKLLYSLIGAVSFVGCSDLLDTEPLHQYTESVVWSDPTLAQQFVYNAYYTIFEEYIKAMGAGNTGQIGAAAECNSDNIVRTGGSTANWYINVASPDDDFGWDVFSLIRQANVIIANGDQYGLTEATGAEMVAQGKFLRALIYFRQVRAFGGYPIVDRVLTTSDDLNIPRSTLEEAYDFMLTDLQEAASDLSATQSSTHISQGAAYALLAEVALQGAAFVPDKRDSYLDISLAASEALIEIADGGKYTLDDSYYNIFNNYESPKTNTEIILGYFKSSGYNSSHICPQYRVCMVKNMTSASLQDEVDPKYEIDTPNAGVAGVYIPSYDLVRDYLVVENGVAKKFDETDMFLNFEQGVDDAVECLVNNRDQRYYDSLVTHGSEYFTSTMNFQVMGNAHYASLKSGTLTIPCGTIWRKGICDYDMLNVIGYNKPMNYHWVLFRLGRSYLNYAEALLRKGRVDEAVTYINKTRTTHGKLPELSTGLGFDEVWKWYKIERRVELFFEGEDRYFSLLRWYRHDGETDIPELGKYLGKWYEIGQDLKSFEEVEMASSFSSYTRYNQLLWAERKFFFPIPQTAIDESGGVIEQNPLW